MKERTRRPPLQESSRLANTTTSFSEESEDSLTMLLSPVKKTSTKLRPKASSSPARRVPTVMSSPAKRTVSVKHNPLAQQTQCLQPDATEQSVPRQSLGSPMRKSTSSRPTDARSATTSKVLSQVDLGLSLTSSILSQRPRRPAPKAALPHQHLTLEESTVDSDPKCCPRSSSPLKRPARRLHTGSRLPVRDSPSKASPRSADLVTDPFSPLKKPPGRLTGRSPAKSTTHSGPQLPSLSRSVDEISLPTPPKEDKHQQTITNVSVRSTVPNSPSVSKRTTTVTQGQHKSTYIGEEDQDEIASPASYTPIRMPTDAKHVQSPPSQENMDDEDDLWTPSVPLSLTSTFSKLNMQSRKQSIESSTPLKQPRHIFFDDDDVEHNATEKSIVNETQNSISLSETTHNGTNTERINNESAGSFVVYIDCKTSDASDSSEHFASILSTLGAKTLQRWNWNPETQQTPRRQSKVGLSHVVFFGGTARTLKKIKEARSMGFDVKCVGLSWVMQCKRSQRLTVGTEGHEVDVEAELIKLNHTRRKSMEPTRLNTPTKQVQAAESSPDQQMSDYQAPVKFADDEDILVSFTPNSRSNLPHLSSLPQERIVQALTEFESKQLVLARRNSFKFRPPVSSPLSKKTWRT